MNILIRCDPTGFVIHLEGYYGSGFFVPMSDMRNPKVDGMDVVYVYGHHVDLQKQGENQGKIGDHGEIAREFNHGATDKA